MMGVTVSIDLLRCHGFELVRLDKIGQAQRQATALVQALRDMANARHAAPAEGYPGPGDLDDLTDQADGLSALLDGITS